MDNSLNSIFRYSNLVMDKDLSIKLPKLIAHVPEITEDTYSIGYVSRYFVQKVNDDNAPITEIDENQQTEIIMDSYYRVVNIRWRITGIPQEIMDSNKTSIQLVNTQMKNLKLYLSNLLQFAKV